MENGLWQTKLIADKKIIAIIQDDRVGVKIRSGIPEIFM